MVECGVGGVVRWFVDMPWTRLCDGFDLGVCVRATREKSLNVLISWTVEGNVR